MTWRAHVSSACLVEFGVDLRDGAALVLDRASAPRAYIDALGKEVLGQAHAEFEELDAAGLYVPEGGGQVVDAASAATGEAVPALCRGEIDVQAGVLVGVKWAGDLAVGSDRFAEQRTDVGGGFDVE